MLSSSFNATAGAVPVRRWHERRLVGQLMGGAARSRAALAAVTGLSAPTVGKLVDELIGARLLEEVETSLSGQAGVGGGMGRPARPVRLATRPARFVAVQLGVRRTRVAALPVAGPAEASGGALSESDSDGGWSVTYGTPGDAASWRDRLAAATAELGLDRPWGVVVSVPGVVDESAGQVLLSPNLHWTQSAELVALVQSCWPAAPPVVLMQEIRALALGHLVTSGGGRAGAAEGGGRDFLLVDFGDGVGAALVRGGELYESALPLSGELGHTPVGGCDRRCGCGAVGCVETLVSRPGLLRSWRESGGGKAASGPALRSGSTWAWAELCEHVAGQGVEPWLGHALEAVGRVIAGAMNVMGVREVVVTGALTELPTVVVDALAAVVERSSMWARFGRIEVRAAARHWAAGLVAAATDRLLLPADGGAGYTAIASQDRRAG